MKSLKNFAFESIFDIDDETITNKSEYDIHFQQTDETKKMFDDINRAGITKDDITTFFMILFKFCGITQHEADLIAIIPEIFISTFGSGNKMYFHFVKNDGNTEYNEFAPELYYAHKLHKLSFTYLNAFSNTPYNKVLNKMSKNIINFSQEYKDDELLHKIFFVK